MGSSELVKLLLDTHIWIWSLLQPEKMVPRVRGALEDPANENRFFRLVLGIGDSGREETRGTAPTFNMMAFFDLL